MNTDLNKDIVFPADFTFGTATSAYQIEGGWNADGKGPSIWDRFTRSRGKIDGDHNGEVACNTYHDFQTDINFMRDLGLGAYRFSISWPRIFPDGRGDVNQVGLDYYDRLVDALLAAGITPFVTLFHWDLPWALQSDIGGFGDRDCAYYFADYAELVASRLGDRVKHWITINEPWVYATLGHLLGIHAPGRRNPWTYLRVVHHQLLAHGLATLRLKGQDQEFQVGISLNLMPVHPVRDTKRDRAAAVLGDQFFNRLYLDSLLYGIYPEPLWKKLRLFHPTVRPGDMQIISQPMDFMGVNYYTRVLFQNAWYVPFYKARPAVLPKPAKLEFSLNGTLFTQMGWEVYPAGIMELLCRLKQEYGNMPIYITENGAAYADKIVAGRVHDTNRQQYLEQHLRQIAAAVEAGVDVRGYFVWSLIDNFEWSFGYDKRFGLIHVDFQSQQRTIKDSGIWFRDLIRRQKGAGNSNAP